MVTRCKVELSPDPLSVIFPTYYDVTPYLASAEWWREREKELDGVQSGGANITLDNDQRRFELNRYGDPTEVTVSGNEIRDLDTGLRYDGRPIQNPILDASCELVAEAVLSSGMDSSTTTLPIVAWPVDADGNSLWPMNTAFRLMVDKETMLVTGGWGTNSLTVSRGVTQRWGSGQAAASHSAGAIAHNVFDGWMLGALSHKAYSLGGIPADQMRVADDPAGGDGRAWKLTVRPGDADNAADLTRERAEFSRTIIGELGERWFHSWSTFLPDDFHENANTPGPYIMQLGPAYGQGSPAMAMRVNYDNAGPDTHELGSDFFRLVYNTGTDASGFVGTYTDQWDIVKATTGVWHDFILYVDWDLTDGTVIIWHRIRGQGEFQEVHRLTGQPTSTDFNGLGTPSVQRRHGIYREASASLTNYLYLANVKAAQVYEDVLPDGVPEGADSSFGIFPPTTNLLPNETWTAAGTPTITTPATDAPEPSPIPLSTVVRADFLATNDYLHRTFTGLTIGVTYTASLWVYRGEVDARLLTFAVRNNANTANVVTANVKARYGWQRVEVTWTATETAGRIRLISTDTVNKPVRAWLVAPMINAGAIAYPYTPVGTARSAGRIQIPTDGLDEQDFWFAVRLRPHWSPSAEPGETFPRVFDWRVDTNDHISAFYREDTNKWVLRRSQGGTTTNDLEVDPAFNTDEGVLLIFKGNATQLGLSVNGGAFATVANARNPDLSSVTDIDLGRVSSSAANFLAGQYEWVAWGSGADDFTDAIAETIFDAHGRGWGNDPWQVDFVSEGLTLIDVWSASSAFSGGDPLDKWARCRITLEDDSDAVQQGVYFLQRPKLDPIAKTKYSQVTFSFVDGAGLLAALNLPRMDPPEAESYLDVVEYDGPQMLFPMAERGGTKLVNHVKRKRKRRKGEKLRHYRKHGFRRWRTRETIPEMEGVSGPTGTYVNTPTLNQAGLIVGSDDPCVSFARASQERAKIKLEDGLDAAPSQATIEAWIQPATLPAGKTQVIFCGPISSITALPIWSLVITDTLVSLQADDGLGFTDVSEAFVTPTTTPTYLAATLDFSGQWRLYLNGALVDGPTSSAGITTPSGDTCYIGSDSKDFAQRSFNGKIQLVGFYPEELSADRILAHWNAGANRGRPVETAGERVAAMSENALWSAAKIQLGGPDLQPVFLIGQSPIEEIDAAHECEMPDGHYWFDGDGDPVYLNADFRDDPPYDAVAVFLSDDMADAGVPYDETVIDWDDELYNVVPVSIDGGTEITKRDEASILLRLEHTFTGGTSLLLNEDADADALGDRILARYSGAPAVRPFAVALHGVDDAQREHIFHRDVGDLVRLKRKTETDPYDVQATILGWRKRYEQGQVTCRWNLSRSVPT